MITIKDRTWNEEEKQSIYTLFSALNQDICDLCSETHPDACNNYCGSRICPFRHIIYDVQSVIDWAELNRSRRCNNL